MSESGRVGTRAWRSIAGGCALLLVLAAGCADQRPPGEAAPALADSLEQVDAAIEAGELDKARKAVQGLISATAQALVSDQITDEEADRIFEAARDVLAQLPK